MLNKCLLAPVLILKLKTALAIKSGLTLFGLGLGAGYFLIPRARESHPTTTHRLASVTQNRERFLQREKAQNPK